MSIPASPSAFHIGRVELVLALGDDRPWRLTMSRGTERFIGVYPRLEELRAAGPLLTFVAQAAARA